MTTSCCIEIPLEGAVLLKTPASYGVPHTVRLTKWLSDPETGELIDRITSAAFTPSGSGLAPDLTVPAVQFDDETATFFPANGVLNAEYTVTMAIGTYNGAYEEWTFKVRIGLK